MPDSVDTISGLSGVPRAEILDIWKRVKANSATLEGCGRHDFRVIDPSKKLGAKYRCANCEGEVDSHAYHWYTLGLTHGN